MSPDDKRKREQRAKIRKEKRDKLGEEAATKRKVEERDKKDDAKRRHHEGQAPPADTSTQDPVVAEEPQTSQSDHPPQTEEASNVAPDINVDLIEQLFLDLSKDHFVLAQKETEAEIKKLEDREEATREEHNKRIEMFKAQDYLTEILKENQSFDETIKNLDEEQQRIKKTLKTLEDKQQQITSFLKDVKTKEELRKEWLQAKPLKHFMSKIKDPEALFREKGSIGDYAKSLFGVGVTPEDCQSIMKRLGDYVREYDHDSIPEACSVSLQLPLVTVKDVSDKSKYKTPSGNISKTYKETKMIFIPKEMNKEEINITFPSPDIEVLDIISSLFSNIPQPEKNMNESESSLITYHILIHLAKLLSVMECTPIKVKPQAPVRSGGHQTEDIIPEFSMVIRKPFPVSKDIRFLVVESKEFPFVPEEMATSNKIKQEINGKLNSIFKQLVIALVEEKCSRGIVCDWKRAILVEIDLDKLAKIKKNKKSGLPEIPFYFRVIDIYDTRQSYLQVLFAFLGTAFDKEKEDKEMFDDLDVKGYLERHHQSSGDRGLTTPSNGTKVASSSLHHQRRKDSLLFP